MITSKPTIINIYKPKDMSSQHVVRVFKRKYPKKTKIGHFGTLDPFASGVLMVGINGAQRLNEYIHECLPKTYIATGILGVETETGDLTVEPSQRDESEYLSTVISDFSVEFIEKQLRENFLGKYMQAPHKYSAAKHEGRALHVWARDGVEIKKEKKERFISKIEVMDYSFPKLKIRYEVSSGTYIRTLFSDCARSLGTLGVLEDLEREKIGACNVSNALREENWESQKFSTIAMDELLPFSNIIFEDKEAQLYSNGVRLRENRVHKITEGGLKAEYYWVRNLNEQILGLAQVKDGEIYTLANFSASS